MVGLGTARNVPAAQLTRHIGESPLSKALAPPWDPRLFLCGYLAGGGGPSRTTVWRGGNRECHISVWRSQLRLPGWEWNSGQSHGFHPGHQAKRKWRSARRQQLANCCHRSTAFLPKRDAF